MMRTYIYIYILECVHGIYIYIYIGILMAHYPLLIRHQLENPAN